jgi:hypothetical protein
MPTRPVHPEPVPRKRPFGAVALETPIAPVPPPATVRHPPSLPHGPSVPLPVLNFRTLRRMP